MRALIGLLVLVFLPMRIAAQERLVVRGPADVIARLTTLREVVARWHPDLRIDWVPDDTGTSFAPLFDGTADLLLSLRAIEPWERELAALLSLEIHEAPAGLDAVAVVVHPDNPIESLSLDQVQTLFAGKIVGWYGFGGSDRPIRLLSPVPSSGEYQALKRISPGGDFRHPPSAELVSKARVVLSTVASDPRAVGLLPMSQDHSGVREVPLRAAPSGAPIEPSVDSVEGGEYPFSRVLWIYRRGRPDESLRRLLSSLLSSKGQREIAKAGFAPLPADRPFLRTLPARERARAATMTRVSFASGLDRLDNEARKVLSVAAKSTSEVWITGHAASQEDRLGAVGLSEKRARAVEELLAALGVAVRGAEGVGADGGERSTVDVWWISRR